KAHPDARFVLVDGEQTDFTEANLDLALRWAEGPGDLEGVQIGPAERVVLGEGDWIGWPGDANPGGEDAEVPLAVNDAGQALAAARAGMGRARVPALLASDGEGQREPCRRAYWLVAPSPQWRLKKVRALVAFLTRG
ncbi:MAG TPA: LysR family transcriptional regulator, partial [Novosphingobium sp.]|nr:LysR family transcriptional regulator [Novosphingobium sp.]